MSGDPYGMESAQQPLAAAPTAYARPPRSIKITILVVIYLVSLLFFIVLAGGAVHRFNEAAAPADTDQSDRELVMGLLVLATVAAAGSGLRLAISWPKWTAFTTILFLMVAMVTVVASEIAARCLTPPWPASALHGVPPDSDHQPWGLLGRREGQVGFNSWGQRDRERAVRLPKSTYRVALIGDSFLDETVSEPLSLVTERLINAPDVEVINLGVSASSPDEYYYRLANVALPLHVDACVMFLYLGNDLAAEPRTLPGSLGMTAVSPRGSLFQDLQLRGLNHLATNSQRPILQAWGAAGELAEQERALNEQFQHATDAEAVELLLSLDRFPPPLQSRLRQRLSQPELSAFLQMLREPDEELFRSYFLVDSLWLSALGQAPRTIDDIQSPRHWIGLSHQLCQRHGVKFLLVIIPQGFAVDHRMQAQWAPLANVARLTDRTEAAARQLITQLQDDGIDVLDLHTALSDTPGAYLNLDGHWSATGIHRVAKELVSQGALAR